MKYKGSLDKYAAIAELYEASHRFPGVVGIIDGTHIAIRMPAERGVDYYNHKDYYSVVLQVVVREDMWMYKPCGRAM